LEGVDALCKTASTQQLLHRQGKVKIVSLIKAPAYLLVGRVEDISLSLIRPCYLLSPHYKCSGGDTCCRGHSGNTGRSLSVISHLVRAFSSSLDIISLTERENMCNITPIKNSSAIREMDKGCLPLTSVSRKEATCIWLEPSVDVASLAERECRLLKQLLLKRAQPLEMYKIFSSHHPVWRNWPPHTQFLV